jgi:hypothetical protein
MPDAVSGETLVRPFRFGGGHFGILDAPIFKFREYNTDLRPPLVGGPKATEGQRAKARGGALHLPVFLPLRLFYIFWTLRFRRNMT